MKLKVIKDNQGNYYRPDNLTMHFDNGKKLDYKNKCNIQFIKYSSLSDLKAGINGQTIDITQKISDHKFMHTFFDFLVEKIAKSEITGVIESKEVN